MKRYAMIASAFLFATSALAQSTPSTLESPQSSQPVKAEEPRPPRVPIVAVGSVIHWNIPYVKNAGEQQTLDVYAPPNVKNAPVVLYVHRGEWAKGDKSEVCYKPKFLNENGVVFVSVNYRLSGVAQHPAQVDDVAAAVRWARDHIGEYGGDPNYLILMGHSAGCHIVTMVGLDPRPLAKVNLRPSDLRGVVSWSGGAFDLPAKVAEGGMYKDYILKNFGNEEKAWRDASPIAHVGDAKPMPRFLFVSPDDGNPGSKMLSEKMCELIAAAGGKATPVSLPGKTHFTADYECGMPEDKGDTGKILLDFIRGNAPGVG